MTVRKFPLAVCVCLTCATVTPGGHAATSSLGASRADQLAEISRYRDQARWVDALAAIERAQSEQSDDTLLYKLQTLTLSDIGNAWLAWQLCKARPDLFDQDQKAHLESNYLAKLVNWSLAYGESEDTRLTEAEDALAQMEQYVQRKARPPAQVPLRIRMDRLILLNRLGRHSQVRDEANALQREGHPLPDYVLPAVSDSMMATRQPAEAIPLLKTVLKNEPGRSQSRSQLVYAYLETEQAEKAIDYLQSWKKDEPAWRWGGGKSRYANWARYEADLNMAMIHAYSGDLPTAQRALEGLLAVGPGNGGLQTALGSVYQMRGWPRRALERHQMAYTLDPRDVSPRIGMYESYIQLQRDDLARPLHDSLLARYPNQPSVLHMDRDWRAHRAGNYRPPPKAATVQAAAGTRHWAITTSTTAWKRTRRSWTTAGVCSPPPIGALSPSRIATSLPCGSVAACAIASVTLMPKPPWRIPATTSDRPACAPV